MSQLSHMRQSGKSLRPRVHGFTLIEMMIAITLGILLSIGLVTLFGATGKASRVQDALAQLQENGRFAITRLDYDLRMAARQQNNISGFSTTTPGTDGVVNPVVAATVYVATINLPDFAPAGVSAPSTASTPAWSFTWPAGAPWPLSPLYFQQGYECSSGTCSPALPSGTANDLPASGLAAGNRVGKSDVLTVRYLNADGWTSSRNEMVVNPAVCAGNQLVSITVNPAAKDTSVTPNIPASAPFNFKAGDLALLVTGNDAKIFQVNVAGNVLTPTAVLGGKVPCFSMVTTAGPVRLYNFSRDFISVTYYLRLDADPNDASRMIPALVRRQSVIAADVPAVDQELVQGVEQLDFLYGTQFANGSISYLTANNMLTKSTAANCPTSPAQFNRPFLSADNWEPGCLWRSVSNIESHVLVDSVKNLDLSPADMAYQYTWNYGGTDAPQTPAAPPTPTTALPNGLIAGRVLRREFVSLVSVRNFNP